MVLIKRRRGLPATKLSLSVAAVCAAMGAAPAMAFEFQLEDPTASLAWDTTVRYNLGWRLEDINPHFANAFGTDETETRFKKHDLISNRIDVFTEADYTVRLPGRQYGARASAAIWSENAYPSTTHRADRVVALGAAAPDSNWGRGGQYSKYTKRFLTEGSGEFVDAFVFGGMQFGEATVDIKVGKHNVYWGEGLFSAADSVAHVQGPIDTVKSATSPGVEAKELYMPLNQISGIWSLGSSWGIMAQYMLDWKPSRLTTGGTYYASSDGSTTGYGGDSCVRVIAGGGCLIRSMDAITPDRRGAYGLAVRWMPEFLSGANLGAYYRKYDDKLPSWTPLQGTGAGGLSLRMVYARDIELFGLSYGGRIGPIATGIEVSHRRNTPLNSVSAYHSGVFSATAMPTYEQAQGAVGNTNHFLINGILGLSKNMLWETGQLVAELAYQRVDKVTKNPARFNAMGYGCPAGQGTAEGCAGKDSMQLAVLFNPQWMGALPSTDLSLPISVTYGLRGNPVITGGGTYEGAYRWSIGLSAKYQNRYEFEVKVSDQYQSYKTTTGTSSSAVPGEQVFASGAGQSQVQNSHRWLSMRFKTAF